MAALLDFSPMASSKRLRFQLARRSSLPRHQTPGAERGGLTERLCSAPFVGVLQQVAASRGSPPAPLTKLDLANGENAHRWPQFLPGGRRFLYWVRSSKPNRTGVYLGSLDRPHEKVFVVESVTCRCLLTSAREGPGLFALGPWKRVSWAALRSRARASFR